MAMPFYASLNTRESPESQYSYSQFPGTIVAILHFSSQKRLQFL